MRNRMGSIIKSKLFLISKSIFKNNLPSSFVMLSPLLAYITILTQILNKNAYTIVHDLVSCIILLNSFSINQSINTFENKFARKDVKSSR